MNSNSACLIFGGAILGALAALILIPVGIGALALGHPKAGLACLAIGLVGVAAAAKVMDLI